MRKQNIIMLLALMLFNAACDDNIPVPGTLDVPVESITLAEELATGLLMEVNTTKNITMKCTVLPENATDRAEYYYSSNVDVATVSPYGILSAQMAGESTITISIGGKAVDFALTVVDIIPIDITSLSFANSTMEANVGDEITLFVSAEPTDNNEGITFASSDSEIATVEAETGIMRCLKEGTVTITASAKRHPNVKAELVVTVSEFFGDYDRSGWSIYKTSHALPTTPKGNSTTAAFDNVFDVDIPSSVTGTNFGLTRPGKNSGGVNVPANETIWFVVDMLQAHKVNYFRIKHVTRRSSDQGVRWRYFVDILGSNTPDDESSWVSISNGKVDFTEWSTTTERQIDPNDGKTERDFGKYRETPDISLGQTVSYRYIKFVGDTTGSGTGNTVQFSELYLGHANN